MTATKSNTRSSKRAAKAKEGKVAGAPLNRIGDNVALAKFSMDAARAMPAGNFSPAMREVLGNADATHVVEAVPGLALLKASDVAMTLPGLAQFPLGVSPKSKMFTGKLMNINEFARMKTGRAWSEKFRDQVLKLEGGKPLAVLPNKTESDKELRKQISRELDSMRPSFHDKLKQAAAGLTARADVTVTRLAVRQTSRGFTFNQTSQILTGANSEAQRLNNELTKARAEIEALKSVIPAKQVARLLKEADNQAAIDIGGGPVEQTDTGTAPAAPVAAGLVENTPATQ